MVNFFIDRPIFALVVALFSMLAGVLAIRTLPVAQYPSLAPGTDPNTAHIQVQNKLQQAMPSLPPAVQQQGVHVGKSSGGFLMAAVLISTDGRMNGVDLANYVASRLQDSISRINGVGALMLFGSP